MKKVIIGFLVFTSCFALNLAHADGGKTLYCQGMVCSETPPAPESVAGFAVVDNSGSVHGVIACNIQSCPKTLQGEYMGCTDCNLVQQTPGNASGNAYGYSSNANVEVRQNKNDNTWSMTTKDSSVSVLLNGVSDTLTVSTETLYQGLIETSTAVFQPKPASIESLNLSFNWMNFLNWINFWWNGSSTFAWEGK